METVYEMAENIAAAEPLATQITKASLYKEINACLPAQLRRESLALSYLGRTEDARETAKAFTEKRPPVFKRR